MFEPVQVGPGIARNRFYRAPHCIGLDHLHATAMATLRGIKAEGGWAVVGTEQCAIHPSADSAPLVESRLWAWFLLIALRERRVVASVPVQLVLGRKNDP
ncbi:MAG: hypothetical protein OXD40_04135 [bacterium]|nr:hypothetical protein [bacterium]